MLLVANWKAYIGDITKARTLFALSKRLAHTSPVTIVLAPPAPLLGALSIKNTSAVHFAAQDVSMATGGAVTGELTAQTFATVGASYAIVGHSERRTGGDTNASVAEKLAHALAQGLTPILCVGEHERDTEGHYLGVVREQVTSAFTPLTTKERKQVVIAYEPVWAINKTAALAIAPHDLAEMVLYIRKVLSELLVGRNASHTHIIYGGSIEPENARSLAATSGVDGFIVGHASTDPLSFKEIVKALS
ncbi:triose-phosphate isomerase [Candidatus Kaiserbacteria bacterium CG10_big_fil_rev_8_21_14_0_10_56_12]|uniref:Triosephosphate isomerase n=1 Tax=Candidatus Kaiserbacteria bacterium CG10_big_fil_rev_8_21_14_0_10_56_12 TaxID=1974611 RepID=A0A2H0U902_9BACT|nr:MAG: triose-phosphate isomerase [Candidatus Kaiserbacteria bacterium CG10_big_fil_rev_8_21_14_0_10_56_12]